MRLRAEEGGVGAKKYEISPLKSNVKEGKFKKFSLWEDVLGLLIAKIFTG